MKVMIASENRFYEGPSGRIYSNTVCDYQFWRRYLQVFDEVVIFARVGKIDKEPTKPAADGAGVSFYRVPMYVGPRQYLMRRKQIHEIAARAPEYADAFILRIPGRCGALLWKELRRRSIPFGVEVVGHAGDSCKTCGANFFVRNMLRFVSPRQQRLECRQAAAAAYVTERYLQKDFPPGGWSTYYSSIDLYEDAFITETQLREKLARLGEAFEGKRPFRLCHAGTMAAKYKGQDILIEAAGRCLREGLNLEVVLMGDGRFRPFYEQKAAAMGIAERVRFLGSVPPGQAVRDEYDRADMLVFPSLTEGLPRTIIEAMARGLPCAASHVGGIPELLAEEFLVKPGDADDLARRLAFMLSRREVLERAALQNLRKAREYRYDVLNERRISFYEQVRQASLTFNSRDKGKGRIYGNE